MYVTCQNCGDGFEADSDDMSFYEKMRVPVPTRCPACRSEARFAWREDRSLYRATCALCKKETISIHAPDAPFPIYCRNCYLSDGWDPMEYGRDYDFSKPFFEQFKDLLCTVPQPALSGSNLVNSDYAQSSVNCKNCYLIFGSYFSEDSQYSFGLLLSRNTFDSYVADNSDHVYETLHVNKLYRTRFGYFSEDCLDSSFLYNCVGCSYCFGCVNVRKGKYVLFNKQRSKEEYFSEIATFDLGSYRRLEEVKALFRKQYLSMPHRYAHITNSNKVSGDIIRRSNNCKACFSALDDIENCKHVYFGGLGLKDSRDVSVGGDLSELLYNTMFVTRAQRVICSVGSSYVNDMEYSDWIHASSNVFGCIGLKNKKYCLLNKQYSPEEYTALVEKVRRHMSEEPYKDNRGQIYRYGDFFPAELSPFPYNESLAFDWYPMTKEEARGKGLRWHESASRDYKITLRSEDLPDHISDVHDSILNETIGCSHEEKCNEQCTSAFRLTKEELALYRDLKIALPRLCWNCRFAERLAWRNRFNLYRRRCMCEGEGSRSTDGGWAYKNTMKHFHENTPCPNEFETTYAEGKPEMVYCDECYQSEFL